MGEIRIEQGENEEAGSFKESYSFIAHDSLNMNSKHDQKLRKYQKYGSKDTLTVLLLTITKHLILMNE